MINTICYKLRFIGFGNSRPPAITHSLYCDNKYNSSRNAHYSTYNPNSERTVACTTENTDKIRCKNKDSSNFHCNFHKFHKTDFALSNLVCLYPLLFLTKHFYKIAAIERIKAVMEIILNPILFAPLKFQLISLIL